MKQFLLVFLVLSCTVLFASATIYFKEEFGAGWEDRWVESYPKKDEGSQGKWGVSAGKYYNDAEADKGLKTLEDARFYDISAKFDKTFNNKDKDLVLQYSVKHEQGIDCGGGYIKVLGGNVDQANFSPDTPYNIMFGPDICGSTKRVHAILTKNGVNHLIKKHISCESDTLTHLYTLILHPDNTYEVLIDEKSVASGKIEEDWDILPPREIPDPDAKKPADWVDEKEIDDPEDKKPEGWDDIPKEIVDPDAKKPDDWDDDLDGEWSAPMIANPEYKGEWKARKIPNPAYKGEWIHPKIANPDFKEDPNLYAFDDSNYVAFELWQVKAGTIFDNIIVTDSVEEAKNFAALTAKTQEGEKKMKEEDEAKQREAEADTDDESDDESDDEDDHGHVHDEL